MSTANVIVFPPKNDGNDVNCIPDNLYERQLLSDDELNLQGKGGTKLITDELQALARGRYGIIFLHFK